MAREGANMTSQKDQEKTSSQEQGGKPIRESMERTYEHDREREASGDEQEAEDS
jgi:hypothetical protein